MNLGILKFLAFEQVFKNSLTTLPMGGGKGGSDFDPKGKSDNEVMRFCQSFMTSFAVTSARIRTCPRATSAWAAVRSASFSGSTSVFATSSPAFSPVKGINWGGSLIRPEATGYGAVYFAAEMLSTRNETLEGKTCLVSGSGNVSQYTTEKMLDLGGKVVTLSDSGGYIYDPEGVDRDKLAYVMDLKNVRRGRIKEYAEKYKSATYTQSTPARTSTRFGIIKADCAFPSATQNEINAKDAANLLKNGVYVVSEGANMPSVPEAVESSSSRPRFSTAPARLPMPAAYPYRDSKCPRTACGSPGPARKSTAGSAAS